ncbi:MAG: sigma-70 family RNA polymerase sigma factor [Kiloniellaceae bacterium]
MLRNRSLLIAEIPHLRRYARSLTRDADAADDLVQGCLERALGRFHLWQPTRRLRPWLFTIMHNLFIDTRRLRVNRTPALPLDEMHRPPSQAAGQEHHLAAQAVLRQIDLLPTEQRDAVLLVGVNELTYAEAAKVLGIPEGTLMSRLHRGRTKLREQLGMAGKRATANPQDAIRRVK